MKQTQQGVLEFSAILLAAYTSLIVGVGESTPLPYLFTLPIVIVALLFWRRWPHRRIRHAAAFVLGLLAFALAFTELLTGTIEARLTAGAHLLVYLTWILLLMRKQLVEYLWLFALCTVQVAIGSVLSADVSYGLLVMGFLLLALWNLAVFSMVRAQLRFLAEEEDSVGDAPSGGRTSVTSILRQPSTASGAIHIEGNERWLSKRFVGGVMGLAFAAACFGFAFFLVIPRYWIGSRTWGDDDTTEGGVTGFSENVSLGAFGTMLQSNEVALEVRFYDRNDDAVDVAEYALTIGQAEPLFRGHTLDTYENGRWSSSFRRGENPTRVSRREPDSYDVRQQYRLRPMNSPVLFAVQETVPGSIIAGRSVMDNRSLYRNGLDSTLLANRRLKSGSVFTYSVHVRRRRGRRSFQLPDGYPNTLTEVSDDRLRRQLTEFLRDDVGLPPRSGRSANNAGQQRARAEQIAGYLRDSGEYSYTLTIPRRRSRDLDPVIEFLRETKTGHCEYYATSLVLLLRADGTPARLVGGFRGGELNPLTGYFDVQQRHAHVWVEAHIGGRWITLDATPSNERAVAVAEAGGFSQSWRNLKQFFRHFWSNYILEMNFNRQNEALYKPLKNTAEDAWNALSRERHGTAAGLSALKEFLSDPSRWMSWQGGLLSFGLMWLLVSIVWACRRVIRLFRTIREEGFVALRNGRLVDFYERFRTICESVGAVRSPTQTQREFANDFAGRFEPQLAAAALDYGPRELATAFYSVRFGDKQLPANERRSIDDCLTKLETSLNTNGQ